MTPVSLVGVGSYLPSTVVPNDFFGKDGGEGRGMFKGSKERRHVAPGETAASMIANATERLANKLNLTPSRDVDLLITNTTSSDIPFTGTGASVAKILNLRPKFVLDMHNTGCISFVYMIAVARGLMAVHGAKSALLCNVQNAAGRVFSHEENRQRAQSAIPGDGCGVGYLVANNESPVLSVETEMCAEYADDMQVVSDDGEPWWAPRKHPLYLDFTESKIGAIVSRGNKLVPKMVQSACASAKIRASEIGALITNQPNTFFLRNWREALQLPKERHVDTFEEYGNLFGAALPINIERAIDTGVLRAGSYLALGGFAHAGDYAAGAIVHWFPGGSA